ncbi:MAG: hypothetical protein ACXWLH_05485 [Candidatus Saccharimonadales bacterium]
MSGTTKVLGATTSSVVAGSVVLPNTGGNVVIAAAVAVAVGLITWGAVHAIVNR